MYSDSGCLHIVSSYVYKYAKHKQFSNSNPALANTHKSLAYHSQEFISIHTGHLLQAEI